MMEAIYRIRRRASGHAQDEAGFTMVEMVIAIFIFAMVITGVGVGMSSALNLTRQNRNRSIAANLAAQQMDTIRSTDFDTLDQMTQLVQPVTLTPTATVEGVPVHHHPGHGVGPQERDRRRRRAVSEPADRGQPARLHRRHHHGDVGRHARRAARPDGHGGLAAGRRLRPDRRPHPRDRPERGERAGLGRDRHDRQPDRWRHPTPRPPAPTGARSSRTSRPARTR